MDAMSGQTAANGPDVADTEKRREARGYEKAVRAGEVNNGTLPMPAKRGDL